MSDFFQQYFIDPIITQGVAGYNIYNTPVYAVGFALAVWMVYRLLRKLNIPIDRRFVFGIFPYIILGSALRVVRDAEITTSWVLVSPIIYFDVFAIAVAGLLIAVGVESIFWKKKFEKKTEPQERENKISRKEKLARVIESAEIKSGLKSKDEPISLSEISKPRIYHKIWFAIGIMPVIISLAFLYPIGIQNWFAIEAILGITSLWFIAIFLFYKSKIANWFSLENAGILFGHMFDATTTFTALQFFPNYYEQHIVSGFVIGAIGPIGQFVLKVGVVPLVLWALDKELPKPEEKQLRGFIKIAILIIGLAPGLRNALRLIMGV